jgi:hypothetical protein
MPNHEYVFVSGVPTTLLGDICDSARNSNDDPEVFYRFQVEGVGRPRLELFREFCKALDIDADESVGRSKAYDYLRRTRIVLFPDDKNTRDDLLTLAGFLLTGVPETIISTLSIYAVDRLGIPIYSNDLHKYLETQGIYPKNLAKDSRIIPAIDRLRSEFEDSIRPGLIDNELIHREETDRCLEALINNAIVILHGTAGSGKSTVLYELSQKLRGKDILCLQVRLDRRIPERTAAHFGDAMGLPGYYQCEGRAISTVLSCRTYDLEYHPQIRNWINDKKEKNLIKIEVRPLSESTVREKVGENFEKITKEQRDILSNPQKLGMWVELHKSKNPPLFQSFT